MTCEETSELLSRYLEGTLTNEQDVHVEQHLDGCPDCANYLESYQLTMALGGSAGCDPHVVVDATDPDELFEPVLQPERTER